MRDAPGEPLLPRDLLLFLRSDPGEGLVHAVFRREEDGALRDGLPLAEGNDLDGEAEEPGEAERVDGGRGGLQRAPEDLGPHVDAKDGLHGGAGRGCGDGGGRLKRGGEPGEPGVLLGELKEVALERGGGGGLAGSGPEFPQSRAVVPGEEGGIPGEPDGEEVAQRVVCMVVHGLLPHPILDVTRPAANGEELLVEVVGGVAVEPELRDEPGDGLAAVGGKRAHPAPEAREAVDLGVGVEEGVFAPGLEEREMPPGHAPGGLARIVVGGAEVADRLDDVRGPCGAVLPVDGIGDGGQGVGSGWRIGNSGAERGGRPLRDEGGLRGGRVFPARVRAAERSGSVNSPAASFCA